MQHERSLWAQQGRVHLCNKAMEQRTPRAVPGISLGQSACISVHGILALLVASDLKVLASLQLQYDLWLGQVRYER